MFRLEELGLVNSIINYAKSGRPLLGICLGMQMLATTSQEFGSTFGLNIIAGAVIKLPEIDIRENKIKVPNIGWKMIEEPRVNAWKNTIFSRIDKKNTFYHIHSFSLKPVYDSDVLA